MKSHSVCTLSLLAAFVLFSASLQAAEGDKAADIKIDLDKVKVTDKTKADWRKHCLSCHGKDGRGKTKAGRKAKVKDMTDPKYQAKFTDDSAFLQIKSGMKNKKGKEVMKAYGKKLNDDQIKALVKMSREFEKKGKK